MDDRFAYFMNKLPLGYVFGPSDKQLLQNYLKNKIMNMSLEPNPIHEVELYDYHPQMLTEEYKLLRAREWYFFTQRNRKYPNKNKADRTTKDYGYWKTTREEQIKAGHDITIGYKKKFDYYEGKAPKAKRSNWKMHEFRLHEDFSTNNKRDSNGHKMDDWVLCVIYKHGPGGKDHSSNISFSSYVKKPALLNREDIGQNECLQVLNNSSTLEISKTYNYSKQLVLHGSQTQNYSCFPSGDHVENNMDVQIRAPVIENVSCTSYFDWDSVDSEVVTWDDVDFNS